MPFFGYALIIEFDKNANSIYESVGYALLHIKVCLATIGVCVFCALASVGALFCFWGH